MQSRDLPRTRPSLKWTGAVSVSQYDSWWRWNLKYCCGTGEWEGWRRWIESFVCTLSFQRLSWARRNGGKKMNLISYLMISKFTSNIDFQLNLQHKTCHCMWCICILKILFSHFPRWLLMISQADIVLTSEWLVNGESLDPI